MSAIVKDLNKIETWIKTKWQDLLNRNVIATVVKFAQTEVNPLLPAAMEALKVVNALVPNLAVTELENLISKYELHIANVNLNDPTQIAAVISAAAEKELQTLAPNASPAVIATVVQTALTALSANTTPATGVAVPAGPATPAA